MRAEDLIEKILNEEGDTDGGEKVKKTFGGEPSARGYMVAKPPSHAPTGTAEWKTKTAATEEEGETAPKAIKDGKSGGAGDANSMMVAKPPSHAPTGTAQFKTKTSCSKDEEEDDGGSIKSAMKENLDGDIEGLADQYLDEPPTE